MRGSGDLESAAKRVKKGETDIAALVKRLGSVDDDDELLEVLNQLSTLAYDSVAGAEKRDQMLKAGIFGFFVKLFTGPHHGEVRSNAVDVCSAFTEPEYRKQIIESGVIEHLCRLLSDPFDDVRDRAGIFLASLTHKSGTPFVRLTPPVLLARLLKDPILGERLDDEEANLKKHIVRALLKCLEFESASSRKDSLEQYQDEAPELLVELLEDKDPAVREQVIYTLAMGYDSESLAVLCERSNVYLFSDTLFQLLIKDDLGRNIQRYALKALSDLQNHSGFSDFDHVSIGSGSVSGEESEGDASAVNDASVSGEESEDDASASETAAGKIVDLLIKFLNDQDSEIRNNTAKIFGVLAEDLYTNTAYNDDETLIEQAVSKGVIKPLVKLLADAETETQEQVLKIFVHLLMPTQEHEENDELPATLGKASKEIVNAGGVEVLIDLLSSSQSMIQLQAINILRCLAEEPLVRSKIIAEGALSRLESLMSEVGSDASANSSSEDDASAASAISARREESEVKWYVRGAAKVLFTKCRQAELTDESIAVKKKDISETSEIRPLITLLRGQDEEIRKYAVLRLARLAASKQENKDVIELEFGMSSFFRLLIGLMTDPDAEVRAKAASSLSDIDNYQSYRRTYTPRNRSLGGPRIIKTFKFKYRKMVLEAGAIEHLCQLLSDPRSSVQESARSAVLNLEFNPDKPSEYYKKTIAYKLYSLWGAVSGEAYKSIDSWSDEFSFANSSESEISKKYIAMAIINVFLNQLNQSTRKFDLEDHELANWFVNLLTDEDVGITEEVVYTLVMEHSSENRKILVEAGILKPLAELLTSHDAGVRKYAIRALYHFAKDSDENLEKIISAAREDFLIGFLADPDREILSEVLKIWLIFLNTKPDTDEIVSKGGIEALVRLLGSVDLDLQEQVVKVLRRFFVEYSLESAQKLVEVGGVGVLVGLLSSVQPVIQAEAIEILYRVAQEPSLQSGMIEAGMLSRLQSMLSEPSTEWYVSDAAKLLVERCGGPKPSKDALAFAAVSQGAKGPEVDASKNSCFSS